MKPECMMIVFLFPGGIALLLPPVAPPCYTSTNSSTIYAAATKLISCYFVCDGRHANGFGILVEFHLHFLIICDVQHLCMCLLAICRSAWRNVNLTPVN